MNTNIRFFTYCIDDLADCCPVEILEITEAEFLSLKGVITYERHTMFENGVNQVCLTIEPSDYPDMSDLIN